LRASDLVRALEENWASELEVLDVEGMIDEPIAGEGQEDGEGEQKKKYWDSIELGKLKATIDKVNKARRKEGQQGMILKYDEELETREREEREWEERRRSRNRGGRGRTRGGGRRR